LSAGDAHAQTRRTLAIAIYWVHNKCVRIEFDPAKDATNQAKHGLSLAMAAELEWDTALQWVDERHAYGEPRQACLAYIGQRLHHAVFVRRAGALRIISLRKANQREVNRYAQA
jgi:uncharacterized DUF497 family protein